MTDNTFIYRCSVCGKTQDIKDGKNAPLCCEKIMVKLPLDQCTVPDHPEMVRNYDEGEPCDDNRGKEGREEK